MSVIHLLGLVEGRPPRGRTRRELLQAFDEGSIQGLSYPVEDLLQAMLRNPSAGQGRYR